MSKSEGWITINGNRERYVMEPDTDEPEPEPEPEPTPTPEPAAPSVY